MINQGNDGGATTHKEVADFRLRLRVSITIMHRQNFYKQTSLIDYKVSYFNKQ